MSEKICTIWANSYIKDRNGNIMLEPNYITIDTALDRIRSGRSKQKVEEIRAAIDKDKRDSLKKQLPAVCFSGKFGRERLDSSLIEHSGFLIGDIDDVDDISIMMPELIEKPFVYAAWVSPSGNGIKILIRIANQDMHREHFEALKEDMPYLDKSGINPSRLCFESYDPNMYVNKDAVPYTKVKQIEQVAVTAKIEQARPIFDNLLKWLANSNNAFVSGERNLFIFKLASACCRFGMDMYDCEALCNLEFLSGATDFTRKELNKTIEKAYKSNKDKQGTASFVREVLIDTVTRREVEIDTSIYDMSVKPRDVIYADMVKAEARSIRINGYPFVAPIGVPQLDNRFKLRRKELSLLSGIGNYGKSHFLKWFLVFRILMFGEKFALFAPEDNPPEEFYHDLVEILLGANCTPDNHMAPSVIEYDNAYDFIGKHFFYVYPSSLSPTPEYIKERFLELIIKEKVDGVVIDPFNQMTNDYGKSGRTDKYLETLLSDFSRFAIENNIYFMIVAHPHKMKKDANGNYPCPDVFDLADGAMWNNKMDNILIYHRPYAQTEPEDPTCEFHSKKIKRQKIVGVKGFFEFDLNKSTRRFEFLGDDPMGRLIKAKGISFKPQQGVLNYAA